MVSINKFLLTNLFVFLSMCLNAQGLTKNDIEIKSGESPHQGRFVVRHVKNNYSTPIIVRFTNEYGSGGPVSLRLQKGENKSVDITCNVVEAKPLNGGAFVDLLRKPKADQQKKPDALRKPASPSASKTENIKKPEVPLYKPLSNTKKRDLTMEDVISDFIIYLETVPFLSSAGIEEEAASIDEHIVSLRNWKDKKAYVRDNHLNSYINSMHDSISVYSKNTSSFITGYVEELGKKTISQKAECIDSIQAIITDRISQREANIDRLSAEINGTTELKMHNGRFNIWIITGIVIAVFLLFIIVYKWYKNIQTTTLSGSETNRAAEASSAIVVRRKTTSILRKQYLDDVIDNPTYLEIACSDFCDNSAVRKMYIKNTCIMDIYNMYAEDLRNPNNPKEDGCMVLGRWVHDAECNEYYVSLEHIVLPGDDAVFAEYELNFGGKIKLKVTEKLRKLRRETNLQYDLTCWVHSHPGLGVFFSNSDSNVQLQLKNPNHPNFLTAIVVDILTPKQDLGIFTFKRDSSISSKADLKRLYSLEELYQWAVESSRKSFKPEDHYDTLAEATKHDNNCSGIELSNGAIIDMGKLATEESTGFVGMVHGFANQQGLKTENVAVTVTKNDTVPDNELVGCFVIATHCSIPSIRKTIAGYINKIKFVLVYTSADGLLTSIPVINQDICTDENFYGEQKLEDLKIWTRRKR